MNTGDNWQRYKASNIGSAITLYCLITILGSIHEQLPLICIFYFSFHIHPHGQNQSACRFHL